MSEPRPPRIHSRAPRTPKSGRGVVRLVVAFVTAVVLVDALVGEKGYVATMRARREYTDLADEIGRIKVENARLRELARRLKDDPHTIEEIARRELGFIRPGETLVIIKDVEPADVRSRRAPGPPNPESGIAP